MNAKLTPWIFNEYGTVVDTSGQEVLANGFGWSLSSGPSMDRAKANAALIVHAVNSLPALVKALEAARKFIADEYRDPAAEVDGHWLSSEARPVFDEICDALGSNPDCGLYGPYGWLIKPAGLSEEHWYLSRDPSTSSEEFSVALFATEEQELARAALASHKTGG
jgi:hypothetical protein